MFRTASASQTFRPVSHTVSVGRHIIINAAIEDVQLENVADILMFDTPGTDDWSYTSHRTWLLDSVIPVLNRCAKKDAVIIFVPQDRKGQGWSKSLVVGELLQNTGWQLFRHMINIEEESDYNRSRSPFRNVYFFRRGTRPSQVDSLIKYRDILRAGKSLRVCEVAEFSPELVELCLSLFLIPGDTVMDPFAGSGAVALTCHRLGYSSISVELDPDVAQSIVIKLRDRGNLS
ncbi:MAG: hypothetical protein DDT33_00581 [Firmicutes bacterium]|nr:hypothetical protein [Bacillota bacterium]